MLAVKLSQSTTTEQGQSQQRRFWRTFPRNTGKLQRQNSIVKPSGANAYGFGVAPNGRTVAIESFSKDTELELWDVQTMLLLVRLPADAFTVAFSPDNKTLATGGRDGSILLWDLTRARRMHLFEGVLDDTAADIDLARKLAADPKRGVALLKPRLAAFAAADKRIAPLIAALDSDSFDERDDATRKLEKLGVDAAMWLARR